MPLDELEQDLKSMDNYYKTALEPVLNKYSEFNSKQAVHSTIEC